MIKIFLLSSVVFAAGIGIPIMAAINSGLGARLANPTLATAILMLVGLILSTAYLLVQGLPSLPTTMPPLYSMSGGFFVVFYVLAVTAITPKIGLGNAIFSSCWARSYPPVSSTILGFSARSKHQSLRKKVSVSHS